MNCAQTLYFDGQCALCRNEVQRLLRRFWSGVYRFVARKRYRLSRLAAHRTACTGDACRREFFLTFNFSLYRNKRYK